MAVSSPLQTTESPSLVRAPINRPSLTQISIRSAIASTILGVALLLSPVPAVAHQPVTLDSATKSMEVSPVLLDGTISFALYADFSRSDIKGSKSEKKSKTRFFRFLHEEGDQLSLQYLIPNTAEMARMKKSDLPRIFLTSPSGDKERILVTERTAFYEPYSKTDYLYLARISRQAEKGLYAVEIKANKPSSVVVAVGKSEVQGDVVEFGANGGKCPRPIEEKAAIEQSVANQLIGMKEDAAQLCAGLNQWGYRVGERDGEFFALTRDYRIDRITVSITKGIITEVQIG